MSWIEIRFDRKDQIEGMLEAECLCSWIRDVQLVWKRHMLLLWVSKNEKKWGGFILNHV